MCNFRVAAMMFVALATLGGCAKIPEIPFDHAAAPEIKSIGLVTPQVPKDAVVALASTVGQHFGLVGALVDAGMKSSRETKVRTILKEQGFSANELVINALSERLKAEGYTVLPVPIARNSDDYLKVYPKSDETKVDAYLDVVVDFYGYIAAGIGDSTPYRPVTKIRVRLVRARDASVLMQDIILYNPYNPTTREITVAPDPDYVFLDFDALVADPNKLTAGLKVAIDQSIDATAKLLR